MMKSQETVRRDEALLGVYDFVSARLEYESDRWIECAYEMHEINSGYVNSKRDYYVAELEATQHEANIDTLNKIRILLEDVIRLNKA